ncbi:MAG: hypothetical protein UV73_C0013G0026 [Candidatus Gottesmanbacteria bacterium GW2011_GWA2_43_14]|uniref:Uncharacterized protein n=1 Tax=Candidatus Gottesmanbacteria bacterium GW2011_GWA2_43_14 TaxID=1618443 RepID=A0A0G1FLF7_9BACT|nr:MAG: hypothetical protein UV73_C0013G0026 [Candidatus Gottesmanbacteria bacterium GW2011_GWA2_43_14]
MLENSGLSQPIEAVLALETSYERGELAEREFKNLLNAGKLTPVLVPLDYPGVNEELGQFEAKVTIQPALGIATQIEQLHKLFERFTPAFVDKDRSEEEYQHSFRNFLSQRGYRKDLSLDELLKKTGSIFYTPEGIGLDGKLIVSKRRVFPQALQYEILCASEWNLLSPEAREKLENSHIIATGLSVGSVNVEQALAAGITSFDLLDPGYLHEDAEGRLSEFGFDKKFLGVNKAVLVMYKLLERYPYAKVRVFMEGLTEGNMPTVFDPEYIKSTVGGKGMLIASEEADSFIGKKRHRQGLYGLPENIEWINIMCGDVGHRVTFFSERRGDIPFHGFVGKIDPKGDVWGNNIPPEQNLNALFASVGGFEGIPMELLQMIADNEIGERNGASISRVPQSKEATTLAGAVFASAVRLLAQGKEISPMYILDVREQIMAEKIAPDSYRDERNFQRMMNMIVFGLTSLTTE